MFELSFYVDRPGAIGIFCVLVSLAMIACHAIYKRRGGFHALFTALMSLTGNPSENHDRVAKLCFYSLAALFALMAAFGLCIALGVIKNKPQLTPQEMKQILERFEQEHQHLPKRNLP